MKPSRSTAAAPATESDARARTWLTGAVALLVVLAPLIPTEAVGQGATVLLSMAWLLALLVYWGATRASQSSPSAAGRWTWDLGDTLCLALAVWIGITMIVNGPRGNPRATWHAGWHWISLLVSLWLVRHLLENERQRRGLVVVMLALSTGLAAHGLVQFAVVMPQHRATYELAPESRKQEILQENGIDPTAGSAQRHHFEDRLKSTEPYATFALANSLAGVLATWLVVALAVLVSGPRDAMRDEATPRRAVAWGKLAAVAGLAVCLVLTKSRAAWGACGFGLLCLAWWERRRWRAHMRLLAAAVVVAAAALGWGVLAGGLDRQVITEAWLSLSYRAQYWQAAWALIADAPLFGCGPGNFQDYYARYKLPQASEMVADPHNFLFEVAATLGLPGLLLFAGLVLCLCRAALSRGSEPLASSDSKLSSQAAGPGTRSLAAGGLTAIVVAVVYGWLADYPPESAPWLELPLLWLIVLPVAAAAYAAWRGWIQGGELPARVVLLGCGVLAVNLLAAGGISYGGVAQSFWLLLALGAAQPPGAGAGGESTERRPSTAQTNAGLLVALGLVAACVFTEYLPTMRGQTLLRQAEATRDAARTRQLLLDATEADPWDPEPWRLLATLDLYRWVATGDEASREAWIAALEQMRRRDAASQARAWQEGQLWLRAFRSRGEPRDLQGALEAFQRAAQLYPNGHVIQAQIAWLAHLAGDASLARTHAERALELNAQNPHWEQKLERRPVEDPGPDPGQLGQPPGPPPGLDAEQLMQRLRTA